MKKLHGILPALITPFDSAGHFNVAACERLLDRVYGAGVHGVYVCGTTGEGLLQTVTQRKRVAEVAIKSSPHDKQVIVHVGAACLAEAVELAKHASKIRADAISSLPPSGFYSFWEVTAYYRALAEASDAPLLIYFMPALSPAITTASQILELCSIPNIIGLKFTDHDLYKLWLVKQSGAVVFNGHDEVLSAGLLMGADGGIGTFYNLAPQLFVTLYSQASAGLWEEARQTQSQINELITIAFRFPLFAALKTMLNWSGIDCGAVLPPRRMLTEEETGRLRQLLDRSTFGGAPFARSED
jgi:N-acetylneuraminate lyase